MALVVGSNTWATVAEADAYLANRVTAGDWFLLDESPGNPGDESKESYLATAFYLLMGSTSVILSSSLTDSNVKSAQIEFAFYLLNNLISYEERDALQSQGVSKFSFSKRMEEFTGKGVSLPSTIKGLLAAYTTGNTFFTLKGQYDV